MVFKRIKISCFTFVFMLGQMGQAQTGFFEVKEPPRAAEYIY